MRPLLFALLLLAAAVAAGDVTLKVGAGLSVEDFIRQSAMTSGGVFLYVPNDVKDKTLGGPYSLTVPSEKFSNVVRFLLGLEDISVRIYAGRWPLTVVLPGMATATQYRIAGTDTTVEFNRPPAAWQREHDAEGAMTKASADVLVAQLTAKTGAGRRAVAVVLGLCAPRSEEVVNALKAPPLDSTTN